jgi:Subtilase family
MSVRFISAAACAAALVLVGCKDHATIPHTPAILKIVSGANQSGDLSAPLDSALVVQVLDAANKSVSGVALTWTVTAGGSLSATSTTTDNDGKSSVKWTLAPTAGTQVATVTSSQIGASVSFVATNGATITGTVSAAPFTPYATFSRVPGRSASLTAAAKSVTRRPSPNRIIVGFNTSAMGIAAAASMSYRSMSTARAAMSRMQQQVAVLAKSNPISNAEVSPALGAARLRVDDTTRIAEVMARLRQDPSVAWVERDEIVSIRDGAPRAVSTDFLGPLGPARLTAGSGTPARNVAGLYPNDPGFFEQLWPAAMLDLPRAWSVTTGSANVIVASVDMGIRFDHPEIAANLTNDGYDFVSQVGFGTTETICGGSTFTTIEGDGDGPDPDPTDPDDLLFDGFQNCWVHNDLGDHGLWTAGIIGAAGNNSAGLAGVNWNVKIRPIRVLGITGDGTYFDIAQGILYAAGLPATGANAMPVQAPSAARIINMSLGGPFSNTTMRNAITAATNAGSLVIASAGNDGLDFPSYPAAYPEVMGIAAVGQDGVLTTYSNAGTFISVAAPGGDFRLDDNGGGGILGPGWDFTTGTPTYLFGYGTSASAPFVSGIAALLLAQTPTLTATQLRSRIEQFATRPAGATRSDMYGWGIVNAYNSLTQQNGPPRVTYARLVDVTTGAATRSTKVGASGAFSFTRVASGSYLVQAGDDESGDGLIGVPGRRFAWAGGAGAPTVFNVNGNSQAVAIALGMPTEVEPNDDVAHANFLSVGSYVVGSITTPDVRDVYSVNIPAAGTYTFETSGLVGSCGLGIELDTFLQVTSQAGTSVGSNDNFNAPTGRFCSRVQAQLTPGIYYVTVTGTGASGLASHGRYRLEVRSGN